MRPAVRIRPAAPRKLCNHNGYRVCFVLSFLSFVGLSNRSSNKLLLCLFLQRCNDQFGNVGIFLQQAAHQPVSGGNPPLPFSANRRRSSLLVWAYRSVTIRDCAWPVSPCTALMFPPPICSFSEALQCPYGIITTNRKSPVYQGFSVIWQGFSSFSKPKNRAAK